MIVTNENFDDFARDCSRRCYQCNEHYCDRIVEYKPNHVIIHTGEEEPFPVENGG